jgi:hypothetical protein
MIVEQQKITVILIFFWEIIKPLSSDESIVEIRCHLPNA